ncbi:MAG: hypothetical protein IJ180_08185 [Bacteroidales bacterium]|nr:hypothetical protein [Bacteroidales bacterium]
MAEFNFNNTDDEQLVVSNPVEDNNDSFSDDSQQIKEVGDSMDQTDENGFKSPNFPKDNKPIVVLCGPPNSGKSMILKSIALYLHEVLKYKIETFGGLFYDSKKYKETCKIFESTFANENVAMPNTVEFLMVDVKDNKGDIKAHFLEAPGEDFFSLRNLDDEPDRKFPSYLAEASKCGANGERKIIYCIILDLDSPTSFRHNETIREKYIAKMEEMYNKYVVGHSAKVILIYNKADIPNKGKWANTATVHAEKKLEDDAKAYYGYFFTNFTKKFLVFFNIDNFKFLPYVTGVYNNETVNMEKVKVFTSGGYSYPKKLWDMIAKTW